MSNNFDKKSNGVSFTALFLIALGVIFLLNNFGFLPWEIWQNLWKFWPVLLILVGIEIFLGRKVAPRSFFLLLFFIFLLPTILILNPLTGNPLAKSSIEFVKPLGNLTKLSFSVDLPSTNLTLDSLDQANTQAFEIGLKYSDLLPKPSLQEERKFGEANFKLSQETSSKLPFLNNLGNSGKVSFSRLIPLELNFKSITGVYDLDLTELKPAFLQLISEIGSITIKYPREFSNKTFIETKASSIALTFPTNTEIIVKFDSSFENLTFDETKFERQNDQIVNKQKDSTYKLEVEIKGTASKLEIKSY